MSVFDYYQQDWQSAERPVETLPDGEYDALILDAQERSDNNKDKIVWTLETTINGRTVTTAKTSFLPKGMGFLKQDLAVLFGEVPENARDIPRWLDAAIGATVRVLASTSARDGHKYSNLYFQDLLKGSGKPHPRDLPPLAPQDCTPIDGDDDLPF